MNSYTPGVPRRRRSLLSILAAAASLIALTLAGPSIANAIQTGNDGSNTSPKPTIVIVHGAFADASGWSDVIERLQRKGLTVYAPANPLRGLAGDSDYIRSFIDTIPGPLVLVGHSYGGAVITNAATGNPNVKALVYIAAFALDEGETVSAAGELGGGQSELGNHIIVRPVPGAVGGDADAYIDPAFFHELFAADLNPRQTAVMAASQRPAALATLGAPSGVPAWETIPSYYMVASDDMAIPPEAERVMAARADAVTVEIRSSHVAMMSHPNKVVDLIQRAVESIGDR